MLYKLNPESGKMDVTRASLHICLSDLFRKSDAVYGLKTSETFHQLRVKLCAERMIGPETVRELVELFNSHWLECPEPPSVNDICQRQLERIRKRRPLHAGFHGVLIKGGRHG